MIKSDKQEVIIGKLAEMDFLWPENFQKFECFSFIEPNNKDDIPIKMITSSFVDLYDNLIYDRRKRNNL